MVSKLHNDNDNDNEFLFRRTNRKKNSYTMYIKYYFNIQQLSIVLMIALLEHFNLEVNEKVSFLSNDSKLGMLFLTNISLALLRRETCKILRYRSL